MPSSYSSILRLEKQAQGENQGSWGTKLNTVIDLIEAAIAGAAAISTTGGSTTLSTANGSSDQARCMVLDVSGTLVSNATLVVPNASKVYIVRNGTTGSFTLSIKTSSGSAITVDQGTTALIHVDGNNVCKKIHPHKLTELTDMPSYSGNALKLLRLNSGGTALEFTSATVGNEFSSGVGLLFPQSAAPTGWTQDTSINDRVISMTSGSGGGTGGSWTLSGLTVGSTTLATTQIPAHAHGYEDEGTDQTNVTAQSANKSVSDGSSNKTTNSAGGGQSHNHSISADAAWRPAYYSVIRATKD